MFRKYEKDYNPKIDYKLIYFLNPLLDSQKNYYETVDIFRKGTKFVSKQGEWFSKMKSVFNYLLTHEFLTTETFDSVAAHFETTVEPEVLKRLQEYYRSVEKTDIPYMATWFLKMIWSEKPLKTNSDRLAILMFDAFLKIKGYVPIVFVPTHSEFVKRMIESGITVRSLQGLLSVYTDLSFKYDQKYDTLSKPEIIAAVRQNKNELFELYGVNACWLYGSFVREEADCYSDVDLYVALSETTSEETLGSLKSYLEMLLGRRVDMSLESNSDLNPQSNGLREREVIFDDRQQ